MSPPRWIRRAALSIEAFHKASLVHDDIEDDDIFRYGRATLHRQYGVGTAINVGDYLIGLGYRLVDLQVLRHEDLSARAQQNTQHEFVFEPRRGDILDAKGDLLATSTVVKAIHADPAAIVPRKSRRFMFVIDASGVSAPRMLLKPRRGCNR